jgi:hypothetical protein
MSFWDFSPRTPRRRGSALSWFLDAKLKRGKFDGSSESGSILRGENVLFLHMSRDQPYILLCLWKRRHSSITLHHVRPSIISRQSQSQIAAIPRQQVLQIMRPRIDVLSRIKNIRHRIKRRRLGQKLHQPLRPPPRNRPRVKIRLRRDHPRDQALIHTMLLGRRTDQIPKRPRRSCGRHRRCREMLLRLHR